MAPPQVQTEQVPTVIPAVAHSKSFAKASGVGKIRGKADAPQAASDGVEKAAAVPVIKLKGHLYFEFIQILILSLPFL